MSDTNKPTPFIIRTMVPTEDHTGFETRVSFVVFECRDGKICVPSQSTTQQSSVFREVYEGCFIRISEPLSSWINKHCGLAEKVVADQQMLRYSSVSDSFEILPTEEFDKLVEL